ncbi:MAG: response regulator [Cyclobacteriaceae bacterium]|nr:response regulator [Cyclobacteriaceae bacterium]
MTTRILLIEDTEDLGENIRDVLRMEGFNVVWARNGKIGLDTYHEITPDLIVTDIIMPLMNGLEVVREVRAFEKQTGVSPIPIIILSAKATPEDHAEGLAAGANIYLKKPCSIDNLMNAVRSLIAN